jgi:hypothetical protein
MMTARAYSAKNTCYIEFEVIGTPKQKKQDEGEVIQIPAVRGTVKSTNHKSNVLALIKQMYPQKVTTPSITAANDLELHPIDIEQVFLQTDKLMEGVNVRYFINPSPLIKSPHANKGSLSIRRRIDKEQYPYCV